MNKLLALILFLVWGESASAQAGRDSDLYETILSLDSLLFDIGFNTCDVSRFEDLLGDDFEFFHDKDGISSKPGFIKSLRNGLCASPETYQSRRELVRENTEIYPLYRQDILYGAIQKGIHRFYEKISGEEESQAGSARFVSVWLLDNSGWKLYRCLSFDHHSADIQRNK